MYIYLILSDTHGVLQWKVGVTKNLTQRFLTLQTGNPNLVNIEYFQTEHAYKIEAFLKRKFKPHRINGEWFDYDAINVESFMSLSKNMHDNLEYVKNTTTLYDNKSNT